MAATATGADDTLRSVAIAQGLPAALRGYPAMASPNLTDLSVKPWGPSLTQISSVVAASYDRPGAHGALTAWDGPALAT